MEKRNLLSIHIIIRPGSYAGMSTEWQKNNNFFALTAHTPNRKFLSLNNVKLSLPLILSLNLPLTLSMCVPYCDARVHAV